MDEDVLVFFFFIVSFPDLNIIPAVKVSDFFFSRCVINTN